MKKYILTEVVIAIILLALQLTNKIQTGQAFLLMFCLSGVIIIYLSIKKNGKRSYS
jgi:hypothetical protein